MAERQHTEHDNLIAVVGALVLGKMVGGGAAPTTLPGRGRRPPAPAPSASSNAPAGTILGGLGDLIDRLTAGGAAAQVDSWVGPGQNQPIQPGQLGSALGQNVLNELSQRTGMSQRELLNQLATVLPQLINHLTPYGRMPTHADIKKGKGDFADLFDADRKIRIVASKSEVTEAAHKIGAWEGYLENVSTLLGGRTVLGSRIISELDAHEMLHRGLPRAALSKLVDNLHVIQVDEASEALGMSVRTLQRHKNTPVVHLDVQQSGRTWKFAEILAKATHVLGSQEEAEQWLRSPAIGLDQKRPIDLLTTPAGVKLVEDYLGRLEYDVYT